MAQYDNLSEKRKAYYQENRDKIIAMVKDAYRRRKEAEGKVVGKNGRPRKYTDDERVERRRAASRANYFKRKEEFKRLREIHSESVKQLN